MKCPFCSAFDAKVIDTRTSEDNKIVKRGREYVSYHRRFTTYERYDSSSPTMVKKDKNGETFDRDKVYRRMKKSYEKKPIPDSVLLEATKEIEIELTHSNKKEIDSSEIGELIMKKLKKIDKAAYVRFVSVYREFTDVKSFNEEMSKLDNEQGRVNIRPLVFI